jgi:anti-anti-sigma factor
MNINVSQAQGKQPVTILQLEGQLDGQTYEALIEKVQDLYGKGTKNLLIDMSDLTYVSSAGLVALHTSALIINGEKTADADNGWASVKSMDKGRSEGKQKFVKLMFPRPEVQSILDMVGFSIMFDIFYDRNEAIQSFS